VTSQRILDISIGRVHHHGACIARNRRRSATLGIKFHKRDFKKAALSCANAARVIELGGC
jgi:hypothetical protein